MTIQTLFDAWKSAGAHHNVQAPATEAEIQAAETKIGVALPKLLREVYQLFNGGWMWDLPWLSLEPTSTYYGVTDGNEKLIEYGWHIPQEIRVFGDNGGGNPFGIWLPACGNPIFDQPIIDVADPGEDGCMGVAGTNLLSFLRGWSAFRLMLKELDKSKEITFLDTLEVPQPLREGEYLPDDIAPFRKWADPQLPDPSGDAYSQQYTIGDLKRIFKA